MLFKVDYRNQKMKNIKYDQSIFSSIPHDLQGPPQSTSDSSWFFLPSSHDSGFRIEEEQSRF